MKITRSQLAQIIMEELGELNEETEAWRRNAAISKIEQFFLDVRGYSAAHEDAEVPVLFDEDWGEIVGRAGAMDQLENVRWLNKPLTRCPISRTDDGNRPKADELPRDCEERIEYNQKESYEALRARIEVVDNQWDLAIGKNKSIMQWITSPAGDRYLRMISTLVDDLIWLPDTGPSERPGNVGSSGMSVSPLPTDPPIPTFQDQLMEMILQELNETTRPLPSWATRDNMLQGVDGMTGDTYAKAMETPGHPVDVPDDVTQDMIDKMSVRQLYRAASLMAQP